MARVVNLGTFAPDDIDFVVGDGRKFRVSGSIMMESMLRLARVEQKWSIAGLEAKAAEDAQDVGALRAKSDEALAALEELMDEILVVLRVHSPDLEEVPFTQHEVAGFLAELRGALDEQAGVPPTSPPSPTGTTPNRAARRKSTPSSGSPASSRPSRSRRTTGGE